MSSRIANRLTMNRLLSVVRSTPDRSAGHAGSPQVELDPEWCGSRERILEDDVGDIGDGVLGVHAAGVAVDEDARGCAASNW